MVEGVGVSDEQLDEWEALAKVLGAESISALCVEVRASHAREAELRRERDEWEAEAERAEDRFDEFRRVAVSIRTKLVAERDVLQQRIDKALETIADWEHVNDPDNFWARSVRAAVTGAGDQPIEETP